MWRVITSVLSAFFGVQKETRRRDDAARERAWPIIVTGVAAALVLVGMIALVATLAAR